MLSDADQETIRVVIAADDKTAELVIPQSYPNEMTDTQGCVTLLRGSGVEISNRVIEAVDALLKERRLPGLCPRIPQQCCKLAKPTRHIRHLLFIGLPFGILQRGI